MRALDVLVALALSLMAAWPFIAAFAYRAWVAVKPAPAATPAVSADGSTQESWRRAWAATLLSLASEIEGGRGDLNDAAGTLRLTRELLWRVIGGDGDPPT